MENQSRVLTRGALELVKLVIGMLALLLGGAITGFGQDGQTPQRGYTPGGSYALGDFETISTTGGNVTLHMPLAQLPPGRGGLTGKVGLIYNSKLYDTSVNYVQDPYQTQNCNPAKDPNCDPSAGGGGGIDYIQQFLLGLSNHGGWNYALRYSLEVTQRTTVGPPPNSSPQCPNLNAVYIYKLKVAYPDGGLHEFVPSNLGSAGLNDGYYNVRADGWVMDCAGGHWGTTGTMTYYSTDGTYTRLDITHDSTQGWWNDGWTLSMPDGTRVTGGGNANQRIYDRNNNYIEFQQLANYNGTGHLATRIIDQEGRTIDIETNPSTNQDLIHTTGFGGQALTTTVTWENIQVNLSYYANTSAVESVYPWLVQNRQMITVVSQITLPQIPGQTTPLSYQFGYNAPVTTGWVANPPASAGWGEISSIALPSGASANYSYRYDGQSGANYVDYSNLLNNTLTRKDLTYQLEYDCSPSSPCPAVAGETLPTTTETTNYSINPLETTVGFSASSTITAPDGGVSRDDFGLGSGLVFRTTRPDGSVVEKLWLQNTPGIGAQPLGHAAGGSPSLNPFVKTEFTSIPDAAGHLAQTSIKDYTYDQNGNVLTVAEYDWVSYASVPRDSAGIPSGIPSGATPQRTSVKTYYNSVSSSSSNLYANSSAPHLRDAVASSEAHSSSGAVLARSESYYDNPATTANLTQQTSWDSTKGAVTNPLNSTNSISTYHQYDGFGNPVLTTDPKGYQVQTTYGSACGTTGLYATQTVTGFGTTVQKTINKVYDCSTGLVTSSTDVENNVTIATTYDGFNRPVLVQDAYGTALERRTATEYTDPLRRVIVRADLAATGDGKIIKIEHYDQLGRSRLSRELEDSSTQSPYVETDGIKVQTRYATVSGHSYTLTSTHYRAAASSAATGESTMGWKRITHDTGGRVTELQTFAGAALPAPWGTNTNTTGAVITSYDSNFHSVTDQVGNIRRTMINGLGQLARVDEPDANNNLGATSSPVQPTSYTYDGLGNLTQINQGNQVRTFSYSSLSRLTSASNPESGTISYQYDSDGNLITKTDARGVTTSHAYDAANRLVSKTYSDGTPTVNYYYDQQALPSGAPSFDRGVSWGRLVAVTTGGGSAGNYYGYDLHGRMLRRIQQTNSVNYLTEDTFNLAGATTSTTYPASPGHSDRRVVNYTYNNVGELASLASPSTSYAAGASISGITYAPHGKLLSETYGNGLVHSITYNSRLQPTEIMLGTAAAPRATLDLSYSYGTTNNNNNILNVTNSVAALTLQQYFSYDSLDRLTTAQETSNGTASWSQTFGYDQYGNRSLMTGGGAPTAGTPGTSATGTVTIGGSEQSSTQCFDWEFDENRNLYCADWETVSDTGTISVTVGSYTASYSYGSADSSSTIAAAVAANFNANSASPVTATVSGAVITLTAKQVGTSGNYSLSTSVSYDNGDFSHASFTATISGAALTGGTNGTAGSPGGTPDVTFNANNQIVGQSYDASGNITNDGAHAYTFDAENRINGVDGTTGSYTYDGEGHRVNKKSGNLAMVYDLNGRLIAEYDATSGALKKEYVYGASGLLATLEPGSSAKYLTSDHLGSPRVLTDGSGFLLSRHDFMPFGEEIGTATGGRAQVLTYGNGTTDGLRQKFTGKERDNETGLDYFLARYYSSVRGRFISSDEFAGGPQELSDFAETASENPTFYADLFDPQSFNKYQYCYNNPLRHIDPDGHGVKDWLRSAAETAGDLADGAVRGAVASITGGTYKPANPSEKDSVTNRLGQIVGTVVVGVVGAGVAVDSGASLVATGGATFPVAAPAVIVGATAVGGAVKNTVNIFATPTKSRSGMPFTKKGKAQVIEENRARHSGVTTCENCGTETVPGQQSQKGVTPPKNETNVDHIDPKSNGGAGDPSNGQVLCRGCNLEKSDKVPPPE